MAARGESPLGVVLAGGSGRRLGGSKATVELAGRPLAAYAVAALAGVVGEVVVVAKRDTPLPPGLTVWLEPDEPRHPLTGLVHALERAGGRAVLACAVDQPLLDSGLLRALLGGGAAGAPAVVARCAGRLEPLPGRYEPAALAALRAAPPGTPLTATVEALGPEVLAWEDAGAFLNVNTPVDLARAAAALATRR